MSHASQPFWSLLHLDSFTNSPCFTTSSKVKQTQGFGVFLAVLQTFAQQEKNMDRNIHSFN